MLVDEAYQLTPEDSPRDFGPEALEAIMTTIEGGPVTEDDRPAFIFAGNPSNMKHFKTLNPGLERRITNSFTFADYNYHELSSIFNVMASKIISTRNCSSHGKTDFH